MHNLTAVTKRIRLPLDTTTTYVGTADTTTLTTEGVDTSGYQGLLLRVGFGAVVNGTATTIKAAQSSDDAATDAYSDIAGTSQTILDADDNKVREIEIWKPGKRWVNLIITRATQNVTVDFMEAWLFGPLHAEPAQTAIIAGTERFNSPAEGTA